MYNTLDEIIAVLQKECGDTLEDIVCCWQPGRHWFIHLSMNLFLVDECWQALHRAADEYGYSTPLHIIMNNTKINIINQEDFNLSLLWTAINCRAEELYRETNQCVS